MRDFPRSRLRGRAIFGLRGGRPGGSIVVTNRPPPAACTPPPILLPLGPMSRFLLILRGDATADLTKLAPAELAAQLGAYHHWATGLGARLIRTAVLDAGALRQVTPQGAAATAAQGPEAVTSVYEVEADDLDHAAALCDGHPGLRFGSIEVRAVQPDPDAPAEA